MANTVNRDYFNETALGYSNLLVAYTNDAGQTPCGTIISRNLSEERACSASISGGFRLQRVRVFARTVFRAVLCVAFDKPIRIDTVVCCTLITCFP